MCTGLDKRSASLTKRPSYTCMASYLCYLYLIQVMCLICLTLRSSAVWRSISSYVGVRRFRHNFCSRLHEKFDVLKTEIACFFERLVIIDQTSSRHNQKPVVLVQVTVPCKILILWIHKTSGIQHRVDWWIVTEISEEFIASNVRAMFLDCPEGGQQFSPKHW